MQTAHRCKYDIGWSVPGAMLLARPICLLCMPKQSAPCVSCIVTSVRVCTRPEEGRAQGQQVQSKGGKAEVVPKVDSYRR